MAKEVCSIKDIIGVEDQLRDALEKLREIRNSMDKYQEPTIDLNFGTMQLYADWIQKWANKTSGTVEGDLKAKHARKRAKKFVEKETRNAKKS